MRQENGRDDNVAQFSQLIEEQAIEVSTEDGVMEIPLEDLMSDILTGHYELDRYARGALNYCEALDQEIDAAEAEGRDDLVELLSDIRDSAFDLYDRVDLDDESG